jgi:hypothetical protein
LKGLNVPFVNQAKYIGVILGENYMEILKTDRSQSLQNISVHSLFRRKRLSVNIKLTFHKALIRSVMTYACPAWEFAATPLF